MRVKSISLKDPINAFQVQQVIDDLSNILKSFNIITGIGSPEGNVKANVGWLYLRTDGGSNTTLYVKESDDGRSTGWVGK